MKIGTLLPFTYFLLAHLPHKPSGVEEMIEAASSPAKVDKVTPLPLPADSSIELARSPKSEVPVIVEERVVDEESGLRDPLPVTNDRKAATKRPSAFTKGLSMGDTSSTNRRATMFKMMSRANNNQLENEEKPSNGFPRRAVGSLFKIMSLGQREIDKIPAIAEESPPKIPSLKKQESKWIKTKKFVLSSNPLEDLSKLDSQGKTKAIASLFMPKTQEKKVKKQNLFSKTILHKKKSAYERALPILVCTAMLAAYIILGGLYFHYHEGHTALDSVYVSVITLMTIGYGDVPIRYHGFATFFVILGAGVVGSAISILGDSILSANEEKLKHQVDDMGKAIQEKIMASDLSLLALNFENDEELPDPLSSESHKRKSIRHSLVRGISGLFGGRPSLAHNQKMMSMKKTKSFKKEIKYVPPRPEDEDEIDVEYFKSIFTENVEWKLKHRRRIARHIKKFVIRRRKLAQSIQEMSNLSTKMFDALIAELKIKAFFNVVMLFIIVFVGASIIAYIENMAIKEAIYMCVVTICTVGYGDVVPVTDAGKLFMIFYSIFGCVLTARALGEIIRIPVAIREKGIETEVTKQFGTELSVEVLQGILENDFFKLIPNMRANKDCVSKCEFMLLLLEMMGKVDEKDLLLASSIFDNFDILNIGVLSEDNLKESWLKANRLRQENRLRAQLKRTKLQQSGRLKL